MAIASAAVLSWLWIQQGPAGAGSGLAHWAAAGTPQAGVAILVITALAVGLEQISAYGLDNLSVPLVVGLLWSLFRP
jgi:dolichol kinase